MKQRSETSRRGISLIEIVVSIAILAILTGAVVLFANPSGIFASARNSERKLHLQAIVNAIRQNIAESQSGTFACENGAIPTSTKIMSSVSSFAHYNIGPCLVPLYLDAMPFDPATSTAHYASIADYDTGYAILQNSATGQITVSAPAAELGATISIAR